MKWPVPAALVASVLLLSVPAAAEAPPEIRGVVCAGDPCRPLPGLLVVLYDADDLLVDSTYSREGGRFSLRPPSGKGRSYVVVTRAESAITKGFDFDPAAGRSQNLGEVKLAEASAGALSRVVHSVLDEFGAALLGLIGLLVGFIWRQKFEDRIAARMKRDDFVEALQGRIGQHPLLDSPSRTPREDAKEIPAVLRTVNDLAQLLRDRGGQVEGALEKLHRLPELDALNKCVKEMKENLDDANRNGCDAEKADAVRLAKKTLRTIRRKPLVSMRPPWWKRAKEFIFRPSPRTAPSSGGI